MMPVAFKLRNKTKVQNVRGTTNDAKLNNLSWKDYYMNHAPEGWPKMCRIKYCHKGAAVGAHVYVQAILDEKFILPMCHGCNCSKNTKWMMVKWDSFVVHIPRT